MYENAKYIRDPMTGENYAIQVDINGQPSQVPLDPANTDYANMMQLVAEGKLVIAPAD
jgi:hypothetical protein